MAGEDSRPRSARSTRRPIPSDSGPTRPARSTSCCSWPTRGTSPARSSTNWPARPTTWPSTERAGRADLIDPRFVAGPARPNAELAALLLVGRHRAQRPLARHARRRVHLEPDLRRAGVRRIRHLRQVDGIAAEFDGGVATFAMRPSSRRSSSGTSAIPRSAARAAARGRAAVLERHTFRQRADGHRSLTLRPLLADRPARVIEAPDGLSARSRLPRRGGGGRPPRTRTGTADGPTGSRARVDTPRSPMPGPPRTGDSSSDSRAARPSGRQIASIDVMFECQRRQVLGLVAIGQDQHAEVGHLERRVARVRRDHQRDPDRRLAEEARRTPSRSSLPSDRSRPPPPRSMSACGWPAETSSHWRPRGSLRSPGPEPVDDRREGVARRARPAVDHDRPSARSGRDRPAPRAALREPGLEGELVVEPDPVRVEGLLEQRRC